MNELGNRIKLFREQRGITQTEFADMLEVSRTTVSSWENGLSSPCADALVEMSKAFHLSVDSILGTEPLSVMHLDDLTNEEREILFSFTHFLEGSRKNRQKTCETKGCENRKKF